MADNVWGSRARADTTCSVLDVDVDVNMSELLE